MLGVECAALCLAVCSPPAMPTTALQKKSKLLTVLLAFLFGSVGAHRFYLKGGRDFWAWSQVLAMVLGVIGVALLWSTQRACVPGWVCAMIGGAAGPRPPPCRAPGAPAPPGAGGPPRP